MSLGFHKSPDLPQLRILQLRQIGRNAMQTQGTPFDLGQTVLGIE
jgi:hypothetical protein